MLGCRFFSLFWKSRSWGLNLLWSTFCDAAKSFFRTHKTAKMKWRNRYKCWNSYQNVGHRKKRSRSWLSFLDFLPCFRLRYLGLHYLIFYWMCSFFWNKWWLQKHQYQRQTKPYSVSFLYKYFTDIKIRVSQIIVLTSQTDKYLWDQTFSHYLGQKYDRKSKKFKFLKF